VFKFDEEAEMTQHQPEQPLQLSQGEISVDEPAPDTNTAEASGEGETSGGGVAPYMTARMMRGAMTQAWVQLFAVVSSVPGLPQDRREALWADLVKLEQNLGGHVDMLFAKEAQLAKETLAAVTQVHKQ